MDERKPTGLTESMPEQPVHADGRTTLEQAFARGSGHLSDVPSPAPERTEHSVMEGLPPAKAERIAAMRRELAELQQQLSAAQQRIATELQGRADDAERFEALEARLQAQEVKAQEDVTRIAELVTETASLRSELSTAATTVEELRRDVATREGELATKTAERDAEQATRSRLERELEDQRKQHREVTSQLESQVASLRDASSLLATRDGELTAIKSERDALKDELAAARAKARDVANQLARFGQDLMEGVGDAQTSSNTEAAAVITARSAERPKPPPVPSRPAAHSEPPPAETILEVTEEPKSQTRIGLVLLGGVLLGCLATFMFVKWRSSSSIAADGRTDLGTAPSAALVSEGASTPTTPSAMPDQAAAVPSMAPAQPMPADNPSDQPTVESNSPPIAPAEIATDGVIVLPQQAAAHRVFVDNRVVRVENLRAVVPCGAREIRIGSRGTPRTLDVACGGETAVPANPRNR